MFLLSHSSFLGVHLLKTFVLSKLLGHLDLELVLHGSLFGHALGLQFHLVVLGGLEFLLLADSLVSFGTGLCFCLLFLLSHVEVVSHVLDHVSLLSSSSLLIGKLVEDGITLGFGLILHGLKLTSSLLLLALVPSDEFLFVLLELSLSLEEGVFLVDGQDHVLLRLLLLHLSNPHHLVVLLNHLVNDRIDLVSLLHEFVLSLLSEHLLLLKLMLNVDFGLLHFDENLSLLFLLGKLGLLISSEHLNFDCRLFL